MRRRVIHIKNGILASVFIVLLVGIIFNSTFFLHTHRTACGKIIVHAHPFNKGAEKENPISQHTHNKIDLQVISSIHYFIDTDRIIQSEEYLSGINTIIIPSSKGIVCHISSSIQKRGPPTEPSFI